MCNIEIKGCWDELSDLPSAQYDMSRSKILDCAVTVTQTKLSDFSKKKKKRIKKQIRNGPISLSFGM